MSNAVVSLLLLLLVTCAGCTRGEATDGSGAANADSGQPMALDAASLRAAPFDRLEQVDFEACELPARNRMRAQGAVARLQGSDADDLACGGDGADEIEGGGGSDVLVGGGGDDWIATTGAEPDLIVAGDGDDEVTVEAPGTTVMAEGGADTVRLGTVDGVRVHCGPGEDVVELPAGVGTDEEPSVTDCETVRPAAG